MKILPNQCKKHSQPITNIKQVKPLIDDMVELCQQPIGKYPSGMALAHCQVDHDNPLRFFVFKSGEVIINPKILDEDWLVKSKEGCLSYPFRDEKIVKRYNHICVKYLNSKGIEIVTNENGKRAFIFQHEIDHFNGKAIYK